MSWGNRCILFACSKLLFSCLDHGLCVVSIAMKLEWLNSDVRIGFSNIPLREASCSKVQSTDDALK